MSAEEKKRRAKGDQSDLPTPIGLRLRHARLTKGLSLKELGRLAGCSESFVSKVEHDKVRPSLATLHRLVRALEINIGTLFVEDPYESVAPVHITHQGERHVIRIDPLRKGEGIALERLVPHGIAALLQANIHVVAPNGGSSGLIKHEGEEVGFVLEGHLDLQVQDRIYHLRSGDSFFFKSHLPHGYHNPGTTTAYVLWVNTPRSF